MTLFGLTVMATSCHAAPAMMIAMAGEQALIAGLDDEQRAAVLARRGPVCVLAGAGTGKTRTITHRIAHLVGTGHVAAGQVLAVTFTQRAAGELRSRLRGLDAAAQTGAGVGSVQALTFHAAARRQLRYFWPRVVGGTLGAAGQQVRRRRAGCRPGPDPGQHRRRPGPRRRDRMGQGLADHARAVPGRGRAGRPRHPAGRRRVAAVYAGYESLKARGDDVTLLDFDDLLLHTAAAIENDAAVAEEFRDRYRCFVVDEYQDVTPLQQRVLSAWLGDRDDLTVVGDANQTIYSFTGATPRFLLDFSRRFPDATVVRLERDYRSTPQVVSLANQVIAAARGRVAGSKLHLVGQRDPGPGAVVPRVSRRGGRGRRGRGVHQAAHRIRHPAAEIAVLYRINAQSEVYEEALTEAGIAFQVRGGEGFFSRQEIRQALLALQRAAERSDGGPQRSAGRPVRALLEPLGLTASRPPAPGPGSAGRRWPRWPNWSTRRWRCARSWTWPGWWPNCGCAPMPATHRWCRASRWRRCTPPRDWSGTRCSWSDWPTARCPSRTRWRTAPRARPVEEERRLLYVGITRARMHLALSWALARTPGGRQSRKPSRFLNGIAPQARADAAPAKSRRTRGAATRCRICNEQPEHARRRSCCGAVRPARPTSTTNCRPTQGLAAATPPRNSRCPRMWCSATTR